VKRTKQGEFTLVLAALGLGGLVCSFVWANPHTDATQKILTGVLVLILVFGMAFVLKATRKK
jgi:uncharacterized membrane protein YqjE